MLPIKHTSYPFTSLSYGRYLLQRHPHQGLPRGLDTSLLVSLLSLCYPLSKWSTLHSVVSVFQECQSGHITLLSITLDERESQFLIWVYKGQVVKTLPTFLTSVSCLCFPCSLNSSHPDLLIPKYNKLPPPPTPRLQGLALAVFLVWNFLPSGHLIAI